MKTCKPHRLLFVLLALGAITACDTAPSDDASSLVIRGVVVAGEPITDIQLTRPADFLSETALETPVTDAQVTLLHKGQAHALTPTSNRPGYYHLAENNLALSTGDSLSLHVRDGEEDVEASAYIPPLPRLLSLSDTVVVIPSDPAERLTFFESDTPVITIDWAHNEEGPYAPIWVTHTYLEDSPPLIDPGIEDPAPADTSYYADDAIVYDAAAIAYAGRLQLCLHSVPDAYWDFFSLQSDTIRRLSEPASNVDDGLGIFAGFSKSCHVFHITPE